MGSYFIHWDRIYKLISFSLTFPFFFHFLSNSFAFFFPFFLQPSFLPSFLLPCFLPSFLLLISKYPFLLKLFYTQTISISAVGAHFRLAPVSFWHDSIVLGTLLYFLVQQNVSGSYCAFSDPALWSAISPRSTGFIQKRN